MSFQAEDIRLLARGRWLDILSTLGGINSQDLHSRHHACPHCGGDNRFRFDDKNGDGTWYCNQCGGNSGSGGGGDGFLLLQRVTGWDFNNTVNAVGEWLNAPISANDNRPRKALPPPSVKKEVQHWHAIVPMPEEALELLREQYVNVWNPKKEEDADYGGSNLRPELVTIVRKADSTPVGAVLRCKLSDGKKWTPQVVYATDDRTGETRLVMQALPSPKPLVGSETVAQATTVVLVEGEKTREAAARLISWPCLTWVGGSKGINLADWTVIDGRKVVIWPDADMEGWTAAQEIAAKLNPKGCQIRIVRPPEDVKKGWDLADAKDEGWDKARVLEYLKANLEEPGHPFRKLPPATEKLAKAPDQDNVPAERSYSDDHYMRRGNMFPDDWLEVSGKQNKPKDTIENCECMLKYYGIVARYNIVNKAVEVNIPGETFSIDNAANVTLAHLISIAQRNSFPVAHIQDYIKALAEKNAYNPVANWIESKPWNGQDWLGEFLMTVKSPNGDLKDLLIKRWMVQAVAAIYQPPPFSAHGILVFQGAQGVGKTTWISRLMPSMLSSQYISTGQVLDPGNKDSIISSVTKWVVELGELGSTLRKDVDRIKAFVTNSYDRVRRPYDRVESEYPRKTVFFASVNDTQFLKDDSGNRRFWVVETSEIEYLHDIDMQQVWAHVLHLWRNGERSYLSADERQLLDKSNEEYMEHDPMEEELGRYDWNAHSSTWRRMSATDILRELKYTSPNRGQATQLGKYLRKRGLVPHKSNGIRYFNVPPISTATTGTQQSWYND